MMNFKVCGAVAIGIAMMALQSHGVTIIAQETWSGGDEAGWVARDFPVGGDPGYAAPFPGGGGSLDGSGSSLQITGGGPDTSPRDFIYTSEAQFQGDYDTMGVRGIWFDFYVDPANGSVPSALQLYFVGNGNVWFWDLTSSLTTGWNTYGANFNTGNLDPYGFGSWVQYAEFGNTGAWATSITSVSSIGIELSYLSGIGGQVYAIDNFTLQDEDFLVPEPETYAFIAMALLSMAFVFRKRLDEQFQSAMAHMQTMRMG